MNGLSAMAHATDRTVFVAKANGGSFWLEMSEQGAIHGNLSIHFGQAGVDGIDRAIAALSALRNMVDSD